MSNETINSQDQDFENYVKNQEGESPTSLGKVDMGNKKPLMGEMGYLNVPITDLPSRGLFYPEGTEIIIRAASVAEIRHWSTIDQNSYTNTDDILNFIIEKCTKIKIPNSFASWKDIKDIDRFYLIFAIREWTFKNGENKLYVPGEKDERIEVTKDMISYFNIDKKLERFYDPELKCFRIDKNAKTGEEIRFYIPSIGLAQFIKNYVQEKRNEKQKFDESFVKFANFIFDDWRGLSNERYEKEVSDSIVWSIEKISVYDKFTELLAGGVDPKISYMIGGTEHEAPLNFSGGIKSLFIISDILDELV